MHDNRESEYSSAMAKFAWSTFQAEGKKAAIEALVKENWVFNREEATELVESLIDDAYDAALGFPSAL